MSEKDNGGPAFPSYNYDSGAVPVLWGSGMTLRDWFAGIATDKDIESVLDETGMPWRPIGTKASRVMARYFYADAMIAERAKA